MLVWLALLIPSLLVGAGCGYFFKTNKSFLFAGLLPWLGLLICLIYTEYFTPYQGGGASMWLVAQFFGGTAAALAGILGCLIMRTLRKK